jgi:pyruvate dehydrogenase E1 component alpha subunit
MVFCEAVLSTLKIRRKAMDLTNEQLINMYVTMSKIRTFEDHVAKLFADGKIPGFVHLYVGEEAVATGVCANLTDKG